MAKSLSGQNFVPNLKRLDRGMDHIQNRPMDGRSIVAKENVNSLSNDQTFSLRVVSLVQQLGRPLWHRK